MLRFPSGSMAVPLAVIALLSCAAPAAARVNEPPSANDHTGALTSVTKSAADARVERQDVEVVESAGRNIPNPLTPQRIESYLNESVTTSKAGRLLVTRSLDLSMTCTPESGVLYFLIVDDVPIRNSAVFSRTGIVGQVSGVTTDVLAAGTHTIKVGEMCTVPGAYPSGALVTIVGISSVVVLP